MAETEAGTGSLIFVDGKTLPAAREWIKVCNLGIKLIAKLVLKFRNIL